MQTKKIELSNLVKILPFAVLCIDVYKRQVQYTCILYAMDAGNYLYPGIRG